MKYILFICLLGMPLALQAQLVVGTSGMTIRNGALFTVDGLVLQPGADITILNTQLLRDGTPAPVGNGNSIGRIYRFSSPLVYSGTMGFTYLDAELAGNAETDLQMIYVSDPAGNTWIQSAGSAVNASTNYISKVFSGDTLSRLTASAASIPLEITIRDFSARKDASGQAALLEWTVMNEKNTRSYTVERSKDAKQFEVIGETVASGSPGYSLIDAQPLEGPNYYRLKSINEDGSSLYSSVRLLVFGSKSITFRLYPNPVPGKSLTIATQDAGAENMPGVVMDISGKVIRSFMLQGPYTVLDASGWLAGSYIIKLQNGVVFKVVKQ